MYLQRIFALSAMQVVVFCKHVLILQKNHSKFLTLKVALYLNQALLSTWPKIQDKNLNILRAKRAESAKLRALRAHMSTCLACFTCSHANVPWVLMCSHANVPCVLMCSRANVPCVLTCQRVLCVYMLTWLRAHALRVTCQHVLRAYLLTCYNYEWQI